MGHKRLVHEYAWSTVLQSTINCRPCTKFKLKKSYFSNLQQIILLSKFHLLMVAKLKILSFRASLMSLDRVSFLRTNCSNFYRSSYGLLTTTK